MFNLARTWGVFGGDNPAAGIELFKEEKRDRFVKPEELPELFKAIQKEPNPYRAAAFLILLLTGARKTEVLCMRWEDLDLKQATWRIPETKAGRPHLLPLPRAAVKLLAHLPRQEGSPYVFPGRRQGQHLVKLSKAWKTIRQEAKLEDVRIHDLRRTLGSWLAASGASLPLIGKALNHSQVSTTAVYARLDLEPVRVALEANAKKMLVVAGGLSVARTKESHRDK
jgi:integrase